MKSQLVSVAGVVLLGFAGLVTAHLSHWGGECSVRIVIAACAALAAIHREGAPARAAVGLGVIGFSEAAGILGG
jgi:hypothetical protein